MSSTANLQLRFDGPELQAHEMDITLLAPSLMAFGEMCQEANRVLNGNETKVKVLLKADVKANCVTIDFSIVQTLWDSAKALVQGENAVTAKTMLEWLGILIGGKGVWTLVKFLLWGKGRKVTEIQRSGDGNTVIVRVEGDNNTVTIPEQVYRLSKDVKVVENLKTLASPVSENNGIEEAVFIHEKKPQLKIDEETAKALRDVHADSDETEPQTFTAHIVIYGPILDLKAKKWKFKLANKVENIDISETHIAEDAFRRGGISVGDTYKVKLEMIERKTSGGAFVAEYKVKEVLGFIPGSGARQQNLNLEERDN
jgi:hypothetical protein